MSTTRILLIVAIAFFPSAMAGRMLKFASPLQSLTIPDPEVVATSSTKRQQFLSRFKAGLQAETAARRDIASKRTRDLQKAATSENWAEKAKGKTKDRRLAEERLVEEAYDKAVAAVSTNEKKMSSSELSKSKIRHDAQAALLCSVGTVSFVQFFVLGPALAL